MHCIYTSLTEDPPLREVGNILTRCQNGAIIFSYGLAEIVVEATKVKMEPEQAKRIIAHFTGQLDRIRRSLSYNHTQQLGGSDVPPAASTIGQWSISVDEDTPPEVNQLSRPLGSRQYRSSDRASNEEAESDEQEGEFLCGLIG